MTHREDHKPNGNDDYNSGEDDVSQYESMGVTDIFDPIAALLSSVGGEAENLTEELRKYGIRYEHLSGLSDEDLTILGMKSKKSRQEVLAEIIDLPNQMEHYDGEMIKHNAHSYVSNALCNVTKYLDSLNTLLNLTLEKLQYHHVENVEINETNCASEVAVAVSKKLYMKTVDLRNMLEDVRCGKISEVKQTEVRTEKQSFLAGIMVVVFVIGGSYFALRYMEKLKY